MHNMTSEEPVLEVHGLHVTYADRKREAEALTDVNFSLHAGESIVLAGESGCGKTTLGLALLSLLPKGGRVSSGSILLTTKSGQQVDLAHVSGETERELRWTELAVVYQGAMNSLNPLLTVGTHFRETALAHAGAPEGEELRQWTHDLLSMVNLDPDRVLRSYPHQLSGGMRQRVLIALSLLLKPRLLVLDEPTTALDVLTQRAIVGILRRLQSEIGFSMVFITHDLAVASELADTVAVMYAGRIVEMGTGKEVFKNPRHPYTQALLQTLPRWGSEPGTLSTIPGSPPSVGQFPDGCPFRDRCANATPDCASGDIPTVMFSGSHSATCLHLFDAEGTER